MLNPHIHAALARERQRSLLAEAQAFRRAKQAHSFRRAGTPAARRNRLRWIPNLSLPNWSRRRFRLLYQPAFEEDGQPLSRTTACGPLESPRAEPGGRTTAHPGWTLPGTPR